VNFPLSQEFAREVKRHNGKIPITLGGWHASGCAESYNKGYEKWSLKEILNPESPFNFIVWGEGDLVYPELIAILESTKSENRFVTLEKTKGIGYLLPNGKIKLSRADRIINLDSLPDPDWEGLEISVYKDQRTGELDLSAHSQRGCRFRCTYCETPVVYLGKPARFSVERAISHVKYLIDKFGPNTITFTDEDFLADLIYIEELCEGIRKKDLQKRVKFDTFASVNDISRADGRGTLRVMKNANYSSYFVGIESLNPKTLKVYNRQCPHERGKVNLNKYMEQIQKAIDISNQNGLIFMGDYMIGGITTDQDGRYRIETEYEIREGFERYKQLRGMPYTYMPIFMPLVGTPIWKIAVDHDLVLRENGRIPWEKYDASQQVTKADCDLTHLRDKLEQDLFTSKGYLKDIKMLVSTHPNLLGYYEGLYKKLSKDYHDNSEFPRIFERISKREFDKL
jgi:radical SAM superfamily enzyme YgiQ (UPF0313 family)